MKKGPTKAELQRLALVLKLARELVDTIDLMEIDVGGHRKISQILAELGPAVDACARPLKTRAL